MRPVALILTIAEAACCFSPPAAQQNFISSSRHAPRSNAPIASESLAVTTSKAALGLALQPVALSSLYSLSTTGCGLKGEIPATAEGLAYVVTAGFALASIFTRVSTGAGLVEAELAACAAEREVLQSIDASDPLRNARIKNMEDKANDLANGPTAKLLYGAELTSIFTSVVALLVFGFVLATKGELPSALPIEGATCWS